MTGLEPLLIQNLLIAGVATSATAAVAQTVIGVQQANKQARAFQDQADLKAAETQEAAANARIENKKFQARQKVAFLANGVRLTGSPLLSLEESTEVGEQNVQGILRSGEAQSRLLQKQSSIARNEGRAKLIGGLGNFAGGVARGAAIQQLGQ